MLEKVKRFDELENVSEDDLFRIYLLCKEMLYGLNSSLDIPEEWETSLKGITEDIESYCTFRHFLPLQSN